MRCISSSSPECFSVVHSPLWGPGADGRQGAVPVGGPAELHQRYVLPLLYCFTLCNVEVMSLGGNVVPKIIINSLLIKMNWSQGQVLAVSPVCFVWSMVTVSRVRWPHHVTCPLCVPEDRSRFLRFVTGRSRLPAPIYIFPDKLGYVGS